MRKKGREKDEKTKSMTGRSREKKEEKLKKGNERRKQIGGRRKGKRRGKRSVWRNTRFKE